MEPYCKLWQKKLLWVLFIKLPMECRVNTPVSFSKQARSPPYSCALLLDPRLFSSLYFLPTNFMVKKQLWWKIPNFYMTTFWGVKSNILTQRATLRLQLVFFLTNNHKIMPSKEVKKIKIIKWNKKLPGIF